MASSKRQQLISTAQDLFAREGYHATGIDRILAESGVAKMTLYKHFRSKDELILAVLEESERDTLERLAQLRAARPSREALLLTFDGLHAWIHQQDFCGCSFIHAAAEFHDRTHPIHRQAAVFKAAFAEHFRELLEALRAPQAGVLAMQLQFLLEGALSMAHVQGPGDQALQAKAAAEVLLKAAGI
ncbi:MULTISPECIES: TetR/AcrR family transcriptional regulator [unclassified Pseudomonas]|uniref:TetR/AcrR family transcriptional regulator n=1 Tax=unclassified Pseudomonas TaxID=196821 RepID=UPI002449249C|nr:MULTISPECIES: TetR/AcrR family transcriptional regulator [unclassified Pseudomonas]MDH0893119.1 TetR/AcrR family transcriptional regulator [Pseudomonas sp. GD03875]MDH1063060.1 TetR/AcrR family transcriptional regulator [Pseudomonas sp. GD03985]